jgi:hypothetical protein
MNLSSKKIGMFKGLKSKTPGREADRGLSILMFGGPSKVGAVWVSAPSG